jgi:uncharacterized protein YneR
MPVYQTRVEVKGDLRVAEEFLRYGYLFSPRSEGFSLVLSVDAPSNDAAKKCSEAKVQLLMDCITFAKGLSLHYRIGQVTEMAGSQVVTGQAFCTARASVVVTEGKAGFVPAEVELGPGWGTSVQFKAGLGIRRPILTLKDQTIKFVSGRSKEPGTYFGV